MNEQQMAVFVKFKTELSEAEVMKIVNERIDQFRALDGLIQKYYFRDTATGEFGGIYIWRSPADFVAYSNSELRASIAEAYRTIGDPRVEVLEIIELLR